MSHNWSKVGKKLVLIDQISSTSAPPKKHILPDFWTYFRALTKTHLKPTLTGDQLFSKKGPEAALADVPLS